MKDFLTKEAILSSDDLETEEVEVWGGTVLVKSLTAAERDAFEKVLMRVRDGKTVTDLTGVRVKLVSLTVVDKDKKRLFTEEDIKALNKKSSRELDKVFTVAQKLSGLRNEDVEEITKNSNAQPE